MEYSAVNLITFLVGIAFLVNGYFLVKSGREDTVLFLVSSGVGVGLMVVAVVPNVFEYLAAFLGLQLKARAILVVSNLTLFVLVTYLFNRLGTSFEHISRLNEELSLVKAQLDDRNRTEQTEDDG